MSDTISIIREKALREHHETAGDFDEQYRRMSKDEFASAFTVGRKKIDVLLEAVLNELSSSAKILDVGCGTGEQIKHIRARGFKVVGLEPAAGMREIAKKNNPGVDVVDGSIIDLPFQDEEFDFVLAIEVLRYIHRSDIRRSYRELLRVTKPGGRIFVSMVNRYAWDGFFLIYHMRKILFSMAGKHVKTHCEFFTPAEVRRDLGRLGVVKVDLSGRLFAPVRLLYAVGDGFGAWITRRLDRLFDAVAEREWLQRFAGHLLVVFERPLDDYATLSQSAPFGRSSQSV